MKVVVLDSQKKRCGFVDDAIRKCGTVNISPAAVCFYSGFPGNSCAPAKPFGHLKRINCLSPKIPQCPIRD